MNWSAKAAGVGGGGVEIKPLSQEEALARVDEISTKLSIRGGLM
jgi:hypothetical protein